jgi:hypothetical protein
MRNCVAPAHIDDTARRNRDRSALRIVLGTRERPQFCRRADHDQAVHGRLLPDGRAYCALCAVERKHCAVERKHSA